MMDKNLNINTEIILVGFKGNWNMQQQFHHQEFSIAQVCGCTSVNIESHGLISKPRLQLDSYDYNY
jgi:hypothetical protein